MVTKTISMSHSTKDETDYLKTIGEHKRTNRESIETVYEKITSDKKKLEWRIKFLERYITASTVGIKVFIDGKVTMMRRTRWGLMSQDLILKFVRTELEKLMRKRDHNA